MIRPLVSAAVAVVALATTPALASAQTPGSLTQLASPNDCIIAPVGSNECQTTANGLSGSGDVAVSPDGQSVYVLGTSDNAVVEFARNSDGSLTQLDSPNDCITAPESGGTCTDGSGTVGLISPQAIAISGDRQNVYVAAQDGSGNGDIVELARNSDGSLAPITGHDCIAENVNATDETSPCDDQSGHGIQQSIDALTVSPDGKNVYVADQAGEDIAAFTRAADGSLSQPNGAGDCIQDANIESGDCGSATNGLVETTGVVISPDGNNVYTVGWNSSGEDGSIAEFARGADGSLTQPDSSDCVETQGEDLGCATTAIGMQGIAGLIVSPDGRNVYTASEAFGGPIAEFSRDSSGALAQLPAPNDCIQEGADFGCGTTGIGVASGYELAISPDGASMYAAAPQQNCSLGSCADVAEFGRNADGSLTQLPSPDSCIQEHNQESSECPGNNNGTGLGGPGVAVSPDGASVYVTGGGNDTLAEFTRTAVDHTLSVLLAGSGTGLVSDQAATIHCPSACSNAYTANSQVTLTAAPSSGSTFTGWSGACTGTGTCQVTMSADMTVTATFTASAAPTAGAPAPVVTGAPTAVTDGGAAFSGSTNPEGLPTTVFFQYGLDRRYSQVGASGASYTAQTPAQSVAPDFAVHGVGPVAVSGLVPNALYHVRLVAINSAGTTLGQDVTFTTAAAPDPGPPTLGQTFNIAPVSGLVFVLIHGHLVPLTQIEQLPPGVTIDSRHGTFQLTTSTGGGGTAHDAAAKGRQAKTQTGQFGGAVVRLHQATRGANRGLTTVMMVESAFKVRPARRSAAHRPPTRTPPRSAARRSSCCTRARTASSPPAAATAPPPSAAPSGR